MSVKNVSFLLILVALLTGCNKDPLDPNNPVTLAFWHPYGQLMKTSMDNLIEEFNNTVGAQKGIIVQTDYVADASQINERLSLAASDTPGAPKLPDIAVIYPRIAVTMAEQGLLADLSTLLKADELSQYIPDFLDEGYLGGDTLYLLPIAKSTEILYVNNSIFSRFANDTGVTVNQLSTIEGIIDVSEKYYKWSGGKSFILITNLFNYAMIGYQQLGEEFIVDNKFNFSSPAFARIWDGYFPPAVKGESAIFDNYGNYLLASGEIVCELGTTASVTFFPSTVTYADNTKEDCELLALPYPVFDGGKPVAMQRGASLGVFKSEYKNEYAAGVFIKWLTSPEQNLRFTADTGYMPVTIAAYRDLYNSDAENITSENVKKLVGTIMEMQKEYAFYYPPVFDGFDDMQRNYAQTKRRIAENVKREAAGGSVHESFSGAMERFILEVR